MKQEEVIITQSDNYQTILYPMLCNTAKPKGSIVILHGMAEHHSRYQEFGEYLNKEGFDVYSYDHRGHGADKNWDELGFFSEKNGYRRVVLDTIEVIKYVTKYNRSQNVILFAHSMGSLIARNVIQYYDAMDAVILSGTTCPPALLSFTGSVAAGTIKFFRGSKHRSKFLNRVLFESKRYTKINERTAFDWLSRNNPVVGKYIHDPYCGFLCTTGFYSDLIKLTIRASTPSLIKRTRHNLPILVISGNADPVGNYGKEITKLFRIYQDLNFEFVDCTLYEDCRHELLNELNSQVIMADICTWINKYI